MARILIADDEALERAALRFIISDGGHVPEIFIDEAENGYEALELGTAGSYDVIFLDIKMPGLDGLKTAEKLRAAGIVAPIVIISAFDTFEYAQKAIRLGVYEYLLKPAGADEVLSALRRSLSWRNGDSLSLRREASASAVSQAVKKLESALVAQMRSGELDAASLREYENLSSLTELSRSALAFRVQERPGSAGAAEQAFLDIAAEEARKEALARAQKTLLARADSAVYLLVYGLSPESGRSGAANRAAAPEEKVFPRSGGFVKSLRSDPLWPIAERAERSLTDRAPLSLFCGLAGPSHETMDILFARAAEALRLAAAAYPVVKLESAAEAQKGRAAQSGGSKTSAGGLAGSPAGRLGMRAFNYIKREYAKDITLVSTARALGVSPFHLSHAISRDLGMGFSDLVRRLRVNKAKELMLGGGSVKEASYLVGFSDQAYFTRVFKKLEGLSPKQYMARSAKKYKK